MVVGETVCEDCADAGAHQGKPGPRPVACLTRLAESLGGGRTTIRRLGVAGTMGTSKHTWTRALTPGTPLGEAAAFVLGRRLGDVARLLSRAAKRRPGTSQATKDVHGLRVATRRAAAALDVFGETLTEKDAVRASKRLRAIRRAAGEARDLDVQLKILGQTARTAKGASKRALERLASQTRARRREAHKPLVTVANKWPTRKLRERWDEMLGNAKSGGSRTLADAARDAVDRASLGA